MKGFKTLAFNGLVVTATAVLPWAASIDWTQYVSPTFAVLIVTGINVALRFATNTPAMSSK
jgi:hypothetical protein